MQLYCANNNTIYSSVSAAAKHLNIDRTTIYYFLQGKRATAANYIFRDITDQELSDNEISELRRELLYSVFHIAPNFSAKPIIFEGGEKI